MQPFDYVVPKDLADASRLLAGGNGSARPLQGGTDLIIRARGGFVRPERVVDLKGLPGMRDIRESPEGGLVIGAACTMNQVATHLLVATRYDLLAQACTSVASYQLRNRATIGGNCCNASPAADTAPALYCLQAAAEIYGPDGTRCVRIEDFFAGPGRTVLRPGEFLIALRVPPAPTGACGHFGKLGRTQMGDISIVTAAVYYPWRITLGAVGPTPLRAPDAERALEEDHTPEGVRRAAQLASQAARPIDDIRASAAYRRAMVAVLVRRGIEAVLEQVAGTEMAR